MVRAQFEDWLTSLATDDDTARAERLAVLFARSRFKTQKELAAAIPVEVRTLQRWLAGGSISKQHWDALAEALETDWRYIIFGEDEEPDLDADQMDRLELKVDELLDVTKQLAQLELERELEAAAWRRKQQGDGNAAKKPRRQPGG